MRHLNLKSIVLLAGLAVLVALAGCGGGSDGSSTAEATTAPVGKAETTTKSAPKQKAAKKEQHAQKKSKPAKIDRKQVEKEIRQLADSGKPIPADSPVAKKIIQALTGNGGSGKKHKNGKNAISEVIEEAVSPSQGGGGSSSGGQGGAPSAGVEKILEQLQE